jgi:hypothetical protein
MKIAALVYGEYREFEKAVKSWDIFKNLDIDYYFSTWNTSHQTCKDLGIDKKINVTHEMINNIYPNSHIIINDIPYDLIFHGQNQRKILYHWGLLLNKLKETNTEYDLIFIMRFDLFFILQNEYKDENIFPLGKLFEIRDSNLICCRKDDNKISEAFFIGKYESILKILTDSMDFEKNNIHIELTECFVKNNIQTLNLLDFLFYFFVRPNSLENIDISNFEHFINFGGAHSNLSQSEHEWIKAKQKELN